MLNHAARMVTIRSLQWPADRRAIGASDTSFVTDKVFTVVTTDRSVMLTVVPVTPPRRKDYRLDDDLDMLLSYDHVLVAEVDHRVVGLAAITLETWNRRAIVEHFYVALGVRGQGVGRRLMERVVELAQAAAMRCVWLETQTINYGAIQFYERLGFRWCGLDTALYDAAQTASDEIALYFVRDLA